MGIANGSERLPGVGEVAIIVAMTSLRPLTGPDRENVEAVRAELARALASADRGTGGFAAARAILLEQGLAALDLPPAAGRSLDAVIDIAAAAPLTPPLRAFAVLLVYALAIDSLLPSRGPTEAHLRSFLERALLNPLRLAGYPFDGTTYDKRQALLALHGTIEENLRPLEASIPHWIHGVGPAP